MPCDCKVEVTDSSLKKILLMLLALNATMFVAEFIVGIVAESTGVLADSLDMLADVLVYGIGLYAGGRSSTIKTDIFNLRGFAKCLASFVWRDVFRGRCLRLEMPSHGLSMTIVSMRVTANHERPKEKFICNF